MSDRLPLLLFSNGLTLASLKAAGTTPVASDALNMLVKEGARMGAVAFSRWGRMPSGPGALRVFMDVSRHSTVETCTGSKLVKSAEFAGPNGKRYVAEGSVTMP